MLSRFSDRNIKPALRFLLGMIIAFVLLMASFLYLLSRLPIPDSVMAIPEDAVVQSTAEVRAGQEFATASYNPIKQPTHGDRVTLVFDNSGRLIVKESGDQLVFDDGKYFYKNMIVSVKNPQDDKASWVFQIEGRWWQLFYVPPTR